eukprot:3171512-Ditylum_brightwellii.AAC.1
MSIHGVPSLPEHGPNRRDYLICPLLLIKELVLLGFGQRTTVHTLSNLPLVKNTSCHKTVPSDDMLVLHCPIDNFSYLIFCNAWASVQLIVHKLYLLDFGFKTLAVQGSAQVVPVDEVHFVNASAVTFNWTSSASSLTGVLSSWWAFTQEA